MPQGTWLGPYVFISLINDLDSLLELHKSVDDCTLSESILETSVSIMQQQTHFVIGLTLTWWTSTQRRPRRCKWEEWRRHARSCTVQVGIHSAGIHSTTHPEDYFQQQHCWCLTWTHELSSLAERREKLTIILNFLLPVQTTWSPQLSPSLIPPKRNNITANKLRYLKLYLPVPPTTHTEHYKKS